MTLRILNFALAGFATIAANLLPINANASELTIASTSSLEELVLTDAQLQALPQVTITTDTPWTESPMKYEGPTLWSVLEQADATSNDIDMVALNDYKVRLTADRVTPEWPIVARLRNGKTMSVREKGPYWIIYPFDDNTSFQSETFYALSIWQLNRIDVIE
jgi:hypothetical protein